MEAFNKTITRLRKEKGLKQAEIAALVGCSAATWSDYERGKSEPSFQILTNISRVLEVSTDLLLGISPNNNKLTREIIDFINKRDASSTGATTTPIIQEDILEYSRAKNDTLTNELLLKVISEVFAYISELEARIARLEDEKEQ